jgi:hypothetical protein
MWRTTALGMLLGSLVGCMSVDTGPETGGMKPNWGKSYPPPSVPGLQGPYGSRVPMAAPYSYNPPPSNYAAAQMLNQNVPLGMVQFNQQGAPGAGGLGGMLPTPVPPCGVLTPPGVPFGPGAPGGVNPASFGPGSGGGVISANIAPGNMPRGGILQTQAGYAAAAGVRFQAPRTQVRFGKPTGMKIYWYSVGPDGKPAYSTTPVETPGRYNFAQYAIYRLKLSNIEGRPGLELYPTMEVVPSNPKTDAFLAHNAVPIDFTAEDFKQVAEGNYITKVIYLPDPQYQDAAGTGIDEILSTRLEPGQDPIQEALKRGSILLVIRMGNVDQEAPNTPPLITPGPTAPMQPQFGGPKMPGLAMPMLQVPYLGLPGSPGMPGMMPGVGPPVPMIVPPGAMPMMPGLPPGAMSLPPANTAAPRGADAGPAPGAPFNLPSIPLTPPAGAPVNPIVPGLEPSPALPPISGAAGRSSVGSTVPVSAPAATALPVGTGPRDFLTPALPPLPTAP